MSQNPHFPTTSRRKDENQQQTQPTYDAEYWNRTQATLVGDLHGRQMLNHCAIPAPLQGTIGFSCASHWLTNWREFCNQTQSKKKKKTKANAKLLIDTRLKTGESKNTHKC